MVFILKKCIVCVFFLRLYLKESLKKLNVKHPLNKNQDQILKKSDVRDLKTRLKSLLFFNLVVNA